VTLSSKLKVETLLAPRLWSGTRYYLLISTLLALVLWAWYAFSVQLSTGLGVTGMRSVVSWAFYIINFVFMIGISHAGTLISAILRVANAEWRRPITRMAEAITVVAIIIAAGLPLIDLGRPDRIGNVILFGRLQSPLIWDLLSIGTYLIGSIIYLYLPLIPDLAACRDSLAEASGFRRWLYTKLSLGWRGTKTQEERLKKAIKVMAVVIIPVAVSVHSVVSWDFAMTLRVEWHNTLFAPYFVAGAIFSGIATIIIVMAIFRRFYRLEDYIQPKHFIYLGYMMLVLNVGMIYFTISEYLVAGYGGVAQDMTYLGLLFSGQYAPLFWFMVLGGLVLPAFLVSFPRTRNIKWIVIAAVLVDVGMWVERLLLIVPALAVPQLPYPLGQYTPTWVEISLVVGAFATFALFLAIFGRLFPVVSIWENIEGAQSVPSESMPSMMQIEGAPQMDVASPSRRSFLRTAAISVVMMSLGFMLPKVVKAYLPASPTKDVTVRPKPVRVGGATSLEEARRTASFTLMVPRALPDGSSLLAAKVAGGGRLVGLFYRTEGSPPLEMYDDGSTLAIFESEDARIDAPPLYLSQGFYRFNSSGREYLATEGSNGAPRGGPIPARLQWWESGTRYTIIANLPVAELLTIAQSMEVS